jgi:cytochrome c2
MAHPDKPSLGLLIIWHILAIAVLALLLPYLKLQLPVWSVKSSELWPLIVLLGGYAVSALLPVIFRVFGRPIQLTSLIVSIIAVFGLIFLYFLVVHVDSKRTIMLQVMAAAVLLVPLGLRLGRFRSAAVALLAVGVAASLALSLFKEQIHERISVPRMETAVIRTEFYNVRMVSYLDYIPAPAVRGGGLARIGDQFVLATGEGHLYLFGWIKDQDTLHVSSLPYRVPVNGDEFARDTTGGSWQKPREADARSTMGEDAGSTVIAWWFRTTGLLVQELGDRVRLFSSHYYWKHEGGCWVERVSMMEGARAEFLKGSAGFAWRTIFETQPCLPIKGEGRRNGTPFAGHFGGGRMIMRDPATLLLTVGDFGFNGVASKRMLSQDMTASYGKTILIHLKDDSAEIFTSGNRNPQGLYMDPESRIWDTEHGPQGGDELNLIKQGLNYGWPIVTYGVDYGTFAWPLNPKQGDHAGFEAPFYAWLPSIGVSNLVGVEKDLFPIWKGDLLVSSLGFQTVFRVRIRNDRVAYEEPILIGKRIRDIAEAADGRVVLWADDDNAIVSLRPVFGNSGEVAFATFCSGCHKVSDGASHRIGPDLWGVIGRRVGSADGYADYSGAMRAVGGEWTERRLNDFIKNPQAAVPGTAMEFAGVPDAESRAKIIDFLKNAKKVVR